VFAFAFDGRIEMSDTTNGIADESAAAAPASATVGSPVPVPAAPAAAPAPTSVAPAAPVSAPNLGADVPSISHERLRKAKRTKVILIIVILLLVAALGALAWLGYTILMEGTESAPSGIKPGTTVTGEVTDPDAPDEIKVDETNIPNLVALFGLTVEEVRTRLGSDFLLTKTDSVTDETNPAIKQLATFSYTPSVSGSGTSATAPTAPSSGVALPSESIYASLDESGKVIDIYYACDMQLLGYPEKSFDELLATSDLVSEALQSAGVQPRDFSYAAPDPEASTVYDNPNSANRKVVKQSHIFSGRASSDTVPTVWSLTVTYDFGAGVDFPSEFREATRAIHLKLA
jgi:hypothetical protein